MPLKRPCQYSNSPEPSSSKRSRHNNTITPGRVCEPRQKYSNHSKSGVGRNFHALPYPLSLLPYDSWSVLHRGTGRETEQSLKCLKCNKSLPQPTSHQHKLFLVAERLSWQPGVVSYKEREQNESLNWEVNYQLGIVEPTVEDVQEPGGVHSRTNPWYPFQSEHEMEASLGLISKATTLSESSWKVWLEMIEAVQRLPANDGVELACEPPDDNSLEKSKDHTFTWNRKPLKEISSYQNRQPVNGGKRYGRASVAPQLSPPPPSSPLDITDSTTKPACSSTEPLSSAETYSDLRQPMKRLKDGWEYSTDKGKAECGMRPGQSNIEKSKPRRQVHTFNSPHASCSMYSSWTAYRSATRNRARRAQLQDLVERGQKYQSCPTQCLVGMLFAFYGTFDTFSQDEGACLVSKHGGIVGRLTSQSADYIVLGKNVTWAQFRDLWSPYAMMIGDVEFYQLLSCPTDISIKSDPPPNLFQINECLTRRSSNSDFQENGDKSDGYREIPEAPICKLKDRTDVDIDLRLIMPRIEDCETKTSKKDEFESLWKRLRQGMALRAERAAAMCSEDSTMGILTTLKRSHQGIIPSNRAVKHQQYPLKSLVFEAIGDRSLREPWLDHLVLRLNQGIATDFEKRLYNKAIEEFRVSLCSVQEGSVSQAVADIRLNAVIGVMERRFRFNVEVPCVSPSNVSHAMLSSQGQAARIETKFREPKSNSNSGTRTVVPSVEQGAASTAFYGVHTQISDSALKAKQRVCTDLTARPATIAAIQVPDLKTHSEHQSLASTEAKSKPLESAMANFTTLKLSYRTLPEFYSMLDKIERTSYVGARYLEAYAEYLQNTDSCSNCWFEKRIMSEEELLKLEEKIKREMDEG